MNKTESYIIFLVDCEFLGSFQRGLPNQLGLVAFIELGQFGRVCLVYLLQNRLDAIQRICVSANFTKGVPKKNVLLVKY